jgi:glycine C-acetyltransferase
MMHKQNGLNLSRGFTSASGEQFNGFFRSEKKRSFQKDSLIDARARRVFDLMGRACEAGVYPFQIALESRTGPWVQSEGHKMLMLSSYDYLGLIGDPRINEGAVEAVRKYGTATGGARLLTGTLDLHQQMERELAAFKGTEECITFSSGYLANLAVMSGLLTPQDRVILDSLSHRSLVDACRLAGVPLQRFSHNDPASLRHELETGEPANRTLIIADGVFSMDGDICRLPELIELKKEFRCYLMIDEAHSLGILGATGRGTDEHFGIATSEVDVWTGSLAKSMPSTGGFVACSQELAIYLQHSASPFIFSAALCPASAAAVRTGLAILKSEPERVARLKQSADFMRDGLRNLGYDVGGSETPVIPVILGAEDVTAIFAGRLRDMGILVAPVMFPAVGQGSARLRLCVTAGHTRQDLEFALDVFRQLR